MERFIDRACQILGIAAFGVHFLLIGLYGGVAIGAQSVGDYQYIYPSVRHLGIWASDSDPYLILGNALVPLTWSLSAFILFKAFENGWLSRSFTLISIVASIIFWCQVQSVRDGFLVDDEKYLDVLRMSAGHAWSMLVFLSLSLVLQVVSLVYAIKKARRVPTRASFP